MQTLKPDLRELSQDCPRDRDWLSSQFNRAPFLLYKFWLFLNFTITLYTAYKTIVEDWSVARHMIMGIVEIALIFIVIGMLLFLYGCGEMLFAICRRKSRIAQRAFLKFQYYLIGSLIFAAFVVKDYERPRPMYEWFQYLWIAISPTIHIYGGNAVLKAFRKNHPLQRQTNHDVSEDFLKQNEAIASEILKHEEQLNRWPYLVYNWWLKFAVVFEILAVFTCFLSIIHDRMQDWQWPPFVFCIGVSILSFFNAYSRFEMETAMRTRALTRSKRAVLLLRIGLLSTIPPYIFAASQVYTNKDSGLSISNLSFPMCFVLFSLVPVLCLVGALRVHSIIEQRETFVNASSYNNDSYL